MLWEDQIKVVKEAIQNGRIAKWIPLDRGKVAIGIPSLESDDIIIVYASCLCPHDALEPNMVFDARDGKFAWIDDVFKRYNKELGERLWQKYEDIHDVSGAALKEEINNRIEKIFDDAYLIDMFITNEPIPELDVPDYLSEHIQRNDGYMELIEISGKENSVYRYLADPSSFITQVAEAIYGFNKFGESNWESVERLVNNVLIDHYATKHVRDQLEHDLTMLENRKLYCALEQLESQGAKNAYVIFDVDDKREYQLPIEDIMSRVRCNISFDPWRFKKQDEESIENIRKDLGIILKPCNIISLRYKKQICWEREKVEQS